MSSAHVPERVRQAVAERDQFRCAYCQTQADVVGNLLEVEHILPRSDGGTSDPRNLCLACARCNRCKGRRTRARDPITGMFVALFNPRSEEWSQHFEWGKDGVHVIGKTDVGRATVEALRMNAPIVLLARQKWVEAGWHPPT